MMRDSVLLNVRQCSIVKYDYPTPNEHAILPYFPRVKLDNAILQFRFILSVFLKQTTTFSCRGKLCRHVNVIRH